MRTKKIYLLSSFLFVLFFTACTTPHSSFSEVQGFSSSIAMPSESSLGESKTETDFPFDAPENWQEPYPKSLCQGWHASEALGAGFSERYLFLEDGIFYFTGSEMDKSSRLLYMDGEWEYVDETLHLTVKRKIVIEGGEVVVEPSGIGVEGGEYVKLDFAPTEYEGIELSVKIVEISEPELYPYLRGCLSLNLQLFFAAPGVGYDDMPTYWEQYT